MALFDLLGIARSSLTTHQTWLDALGHNIANVNTARPTDQAAFQAQYVIAEADSAGGVNVDGIALGLEAQLRLLAGNAGVQILL